MKDGEEGKGGGGGAQGFVGDVVKWMAAAEPTIVK